MITTTNLCMLGGAALVAGPSFFLFPHQTITGSDANSVENPFVQPQDPAESGGGRDQTLQFGDVMRGGDRADLLIGRLGVDVLLGAGGDDVLVGGTEHFNPQNRDRAFGGDGDDVFLWAPGDGSDFFDGGDGLDTVVFGLMGEIEGEEVVFRVSNDQQAGNVFLHEEIGLPIMDVRNSPGFCQVIDRSSSEDAEAELEALGLDHLVKFFIRAIADSYERGEQDTDNGLRVTLHLDDVEILVCTSRDGGSVEAFDLRASPPQRIPTYVLPVRVQAMLR